MPLLADIHNHALFGVDDGAKDLEEAEAMLAMSYAEGVRLLCLTPHGDDCRFPEGREAEEHYAMLLALCQEKYPALRLYLGHEVFGYQDSAASLTEGRYRPLGEGKTVLVEFLPDISFRDMCNILLSYRSAGYFPLLAHAERYECLAFSIDRVKELVGMLVRIQINASSLERRLALTRYEKAARRMMAHDLVYVVASDAHDQKQRSPSLMAAYKKTEKQYGSTRARLLFYENPRRILTGEKGKEI